MIFFLLLCAYKWDVDVNFIEKIKERIYSYGEFKI